MVELFVSLPENRKINLILFDRFTEAKMGKQELQAHFKIYHLLELGACGNGNESCKAS
jgi:hypothetical protein